MRVNFLFCLLFVYHVGTSQSASFIQVKPKFHVLPVINPERHYLQGSVEFLFSNRLGLEVGYGRRIYEKPNPETVRAFGECLLAELNYYTTVLNRKKVRLRVYGGLSFRKITDIHNDVLKLRQDLPNKTSIPVSDHVGVHKELKIFATRAGIEVLFCDRLGLEGFVEPGVKYKEQYLMNSTLWGQANIRRDYRSGPEVMNKFPYKGYQLNLNAGIRIFYLINFSKKEKI